MTELKIKEVSQFIEKDVQKTKLVINENNKDTEIIFSGNGKLKVPVQA